MVTVSYRVNVTELPAHVIPKTQTVGNGSDTWIVIDNTYKYRSYADHQVASIQ